MAWCKPKRTRESLPPEGETVAEIVDMQRKVSKRSGRDMVEMTCIVEHQGKAVRIKDWFVAGFAAEKVEAVRLAVGKEADGFRLSNQVGCRFYARIGHRPPEGDYGWSAEFAEYIEPGPSGPPEAGSWERPPENDEIPY